MNVYCLHECPDQSARWLVNRHVSKMGLEAVQLLCTTYHEQGFESPYRSTHKNHPNRLWTGASYDNFQWVIAHAHAIFDEYKARYCKVHKSLSVLEWCEDNIHKLSFDSYDLTDFAIAIADDCECRKLPNFKSLSSIEKYRAYYFFDKQHIAAWKRNRPEWYCDEYFKN